MKNNLFILFVVFLCQNNYAQDIFVSKLTANNPLSLTDVVYVGKKDSIMVSKYNGQISLVTKNGKSEHKIVNLKDEVYALAYHPFSKEIIASSLENGVFVIDFKTHKIKKNLVVEHNWTNSLIFSSDLKYLLGQDQDKKALVWDVTKNYEKVILDSKFPLGRILDIKDGIATVYDLRKIFTWNLKDNSVIESANVTPSFFSEIDKENNVLSIYLNECYYFDYAKKQTVFTFKHPDYKVYGIENGKRVESIEKFSLGISSAKFCKNLIITAGVDRSLRIWDRKSGELLKTFWEHEGKISKIVCSSDQNQAVTIDLRGGIKFWHVTDFEKK